MRIQGKPEKVWRQQNISTYLINLTVYNQQAGVEIRQWADC
jgi:hypothetical protein